MEKFINDVVTRLSTRFSSDDLVIIKETIYTTIKDYDVVPKSTELSTIHLECPRELKIYLASRKVEGLADSTIKQYGMELKSLLMYCNKPLDKIDTEDIRLYLYEVKTRGKLQNRTMETKRNYINTFFKWLTDNKYLQSNPCSPIAPFKYEKKLKQGLSDIEMERLRLACANAYEKAVIEVLYSTACRVSELVNIRLSDIDFDRKEIRIIQGKGNKSRLTFMNAKAIIAIEEYIKGRDYPTMYLFEASKRPHGKMSARSIQKTCQSLQERTGVRLTPHKVRRTTATALWRKGMPLEEIKQLLGHEELSTTLIYTNVDKEAVKRDHLKYL